MARPRKEGMEYFPHDTDAVSDEKIEALRALYGNDGYAFYFILLERIYRTSSFELDVSDAETRQILARKVGVTLQKFEEMLSTALKHGCFDRREYEDRQVLTSNGIKRRAEPVVRKRHNQREKYTSEATRVSAAETMPETPQSIVKNSKAEKKKDHVPPPVDSVDNPPEGGEDPCREFMDFYNEVFKGLWKRPLQLTPDRRIKIKARLKEFTLEELKQATISIRASPHHCGDNPNRMVYATPEFICRNQSQVDKWLKRTEVIGDGKCGAPEKQSDEARRLSQLVL
jgi:hypothetical protein